MAPQRYEVCTLCRKGHWVTWHLISICLLWTAVYPDGKVCISILHAPGEDRFNEQESADERWRPILGVESIIISVISMLSDPNDESPANIDAAVSNLNRRNTVSE